MIYSCDSRARSVVIRVHLCLAVAGTYTTQPAGLYLLGCVRGSGGALVQSMDSQNLLMKHDMTGEVAAVSVLMERENLWRQCESYVNVLCR